MDIRVLFFILTLVTVVAFLAGRRTSPSGRVVHRLQREIETRSAELAQYKVQTAQFLDEMRADMGKLNHLQQDIEDRLAEGAKRFDAAPVLENSRVDGHKLETGRDWQASTRRVPEGPNVESTMPAACPVSPEHFLREAPRDYVLPDMRAMSGDSALASLPSIKSGL